MKRPWGEDWDTWFILAASLGVVTAYAAGMYVVYLVLR